MKVTDLDYHLEDKLLKILDYFAVMVTREKQKQDVFLTVHGLTGSGKTNTSILVGYYLKYKTKRPLNLFFDLGSMIDFCKKTENQIVIWDEPALDSLRADQATSLNKDLMRLINTMRKKRHIVIQNITKFWRFKEDLVADRSLGFIHMHNKADTSPGRFLYIRQKNLAYLWQDYMVKHKKSYARLKSFGGWMPEVLEKRNADGKRYFDLMDITVSGHPHATYEDYERLKDKAIESIGGGEGMISKKEMAQRVLMQRLRKAIATIVYDTNINLSRAAHLTGMSARSFAIWREIDLTQPPPSENQFDFAENSALFSEGYGKTGFKGSETVPTFIRLGDGQENQTDVRKEQLETESLEPRTGSKRKPLSVASRFEAEEVPINSIVRTPKPLFGGTKKKNKLPGESSN